MSQLSLNVHKIIYQNYIELYPKCIELLNIFYPNGITNSTKYVKDPFFENDKNLKDLYKWYLSKNEK